MADLVTEIKRIVKEYIENEGLADVLYGTYTGAGVKLESKPVTVGMDMVDVPRHLQTIQGEISFTVTKDDVNSDGQKILMAEPEIESVAVNKLPITIQTGLSPGERVAVVQKRGGQRYAIIDRM